ncbi:MAG: biotin/lipoyl-binding protein [Acidobacteria bacterium]|nr:biotin/lipoyl-binding protein [Acidobacteriota bacterium]
MKKRIAIVVIIVAAGVGVAAWLGAFGQPKELLSSGTVEARNIRVGSKIGGRITEVKVREGDAVEAGQVLVTFDEQELLAALEQARANAEKLERGVRS